MLISRERHRKLKNMNKILNSYILREISFPFFMSLIILTFVLLIGQILQIMDMMVNKGVSTLDIAQLVLFLMPKFLVFTIPIALLIATLIGLGRLSGDNEIIVMKASGIGLYQIIRPIMVLAMATAIATAILSLFIAPSSNDAMKNLLFSILQHRASIGLKEKVFNGEFKGLVIYADHIPASGELMQGVLISDSRMGNETSTIIAQTGKLYSNEKAMSVTLRLENGSIHSVNTSHSNYKKTAFSSYDIQLDLATPGGGNVNKSISELSIRDLIKNRAHQENPQRQREFTIELHKKFSVPLACFIFGILGVPLGITSSRSGKSRGFTVGIVIVLLYYVLQLGGEALGETGRIPAVLGVWTPTVIFAIGSLVLFIMAAKEIQLGRILRLSGRGLYR